MIPTLPTLYKLSTKGKPQFWEISYDGATIITKWGYIDGEVQETRDVITKGKNVGKKNETSPEEQALSEAQSQWEKKLKKGYVKSITDAREGKRDAVITGGVDPMLAHRFDEQGGKIIYPCYVDAKYDGTRCIAMIDANGKATLWSRTRKPITSMAHIITALEAMGITDTVLDGELYAHSHKDNFEQLISFIRDTDAKQGSEQVEYHIYDVVNDKVFWERDTLLKLMPIKHPLMRVERVKVESEDELMMAFENYLKGGYEGAIARNMDGKYVGKRSYDLQKIKEFQDAEFEIIGVEEGRGKLAGHAIFVCKTADGTAFKAKMKGDTANLKQYWDDPSLAIGKHLTVQYFGVTNKSSVPRFPVGLRIREDV